MDSIKLLTALGLLVSTIGFGIAVSLTKDTMLKVPNALHAGVFFVLGAIFLCLFLGV